MDSKEESMDLSVNFQKEKKNLKILEKTIL